MKVFYCGENPHHEQQMISMNQVEANGGHFFAETRAYGEAHLILDKRIYKIQAEFDNGKILEIKWPYTNLEQIHEKEWQFDVEEEEIKSINPRI